MESVKEQKAFYLKYPESNASKCIRFIVENLIFKEPAEELSKDMTTFWNNCFNYLKGNLLVNDIDSNNDVKEDIFSKQEKNYNTLLPDKKNEKTGNSVDKVSEEIHEMNSRLRLDNVVLVGSEQRDFISSVSNNNSGFSLDYEDYIQKKESMVRGKNG